ncbi:MAG TPA: arginase family protein [Longimicrobium sp.]|nr:arginase family protein [Longimicrobium sp.]
MPVDLITVPYDTARREKRMGAGPEHFLANGAAKRLRAIAGRVRETTVGADRHFPAEIHTAFELARGIALAVRAARGHSALPLVLAGNCMASVGVLGGLETEGLGIVWLDAHGDLHTPETTTSGMLDGMALATATGRCWTALAGTVDGFTAVSDERVLLVGGNALDGPELRLLEGSLMLHAAPSQVRGRGTGRPLAELLDALASRVRRVYLHVDLDVHDPAEGKANEFWAPAGLTADEVRSVVREVAARVPIAGASITAYDPALDPEGRMLETGLELMELIAGLSASEAS